RLGTSFAQWTRTAVIEPLELESTTMDGSPAYSATGSTMDVLALGIEMLHPTLISPALGAEARRVAFPGLPGILPGFGRQLNNDWGLGYEIRADKTPHWTAPEANPATFGHFGQSGSFVWVDPGAGLVAAFLGAQACPAAVPGVAWPRVNSATLAARQPG